MLARDTAQVYAVLVEIESPCKKWFNKNGQPSADLTQAMHQLREWKVWFAEPGNVEGFLEEYHVPHDFRRRGFTQRYILIYGRRDELTGGGFARMRPRHEQADEKFLSYDSLAANSNLRDVLTVRVDGKGYRAVVAPPTLRLGPFQAADLSQVADKVQSVDVHPLMPRERAAFLRERLSYWDSWVASENRGSFSFETE